MVRLLSTPCYEGVDVQVHDHMLNSNWFAGQQVWLACGASSSEGFFKPTTDHKGELNHVLANLLAVLHMALTVRCKRSMAALLVRLHQWHQFYVNWMIRFLVRNKLEQSWCVLQH